MYPRRTWLLSLAGCVLVAGCATVPRVPRPAVPWDARVETLQHADAWRMQGRAAVAYGDEGWQATLDWQQAGAASDLKLTGPFGLGGLEIRRDADGVTVNAGHAGTADTGGATIDDLQARLGFELPLDDLKYWLLGVPNPAAASAVTRNEADRAASLTQSGWRVLYERYSASGADYLPARLVLTRDRVRVRIVVDHWEGVP